MADALAIPSYYSPLSLTSGLFREKIELSLGGSWFEMTEQTTVQDYRLRAIQERIARVVEADPRDPIQDDLSELYGLVERGAWLESPQRDLLARVMLELPL